VFSYTAYGLSIRSALPLPEFKASDDFRETADVVIYLGSVDRVPSQTQMEPHFYATAEEVCLWWEHIGAILVRKGREIIADPTLQAQEETLRLCITGPALGVLLHQRGLLALHASAVAVAGKVVAFLGAAGWGKSTMAAVMYARGHDLLADDVTAVEPSSGRSWVFPAFPQLKLWPESIIALGDDPASLPRLDPNFEKRSRRTTRGFSSAPLPLKQIYVLAEGRTQGIEPLQPQEALIELVGHSYVSRLLQYVGASAHFLRCASIVKAVDIRTLKRPRSLCSLSEVAQLVEEDLAQRTEEDLGIKGSL
jgi:hypothetical protein